MSNFLNNKICTLSRISPLLLACKVGTRTRYLQLLQKWSKGKPCQKIFAILILFVGLGIGSLHAQVENIPVTNPVYDFLLNIETKGILKHYSLTQIPWQKKKIVAAIKLVRANDTMLSNAEKQVLTKFEKEFNAVDARHLVVFNSDSDSNSLFFNRILSDAEKFIYHYVDSNSQVSLVPLAAIEYVLHTNVTDSRSLFEHDNTTNLLDGTLGLRLAGTLSNNFGYSLQITNTAALQGDTALLNLNHKFVKNISLNVYHSDADLQESHIAYQNDWFYASLGRESRLYGAGLEQKLIVNNMTPAFDALTLAAKFKTFEYSFSHNSLIGSAITNETVGANAVIPGKYLAIHSFTFLPHWGEISFFETVIYSRDIDLAYLSPLSFFKSLEHAQHDRDNAGMGFTAVVRPIKHLQLKATWFLDDIRFSYIGENFWSNKTAWNIAAITSVVPNVTAGLEYTRVEPYTFSHFNPQNANTNDNILFSSAILPNSDRISVIFDYFWGQRYPIQIKYSYTRHGENIYDADGKLLRNVGGDPNQNFRWNDTIQDNATVKFLDGNLIESHILDITAGYEIIRGLNIQLAFSVIKPKQSETRSYVRLALCLFEF